MTLRILVVDDHDDFRTLLRHHIGLKWPAAQIDEYDPLKAGPLPADFDGAGADVVLLDYQLGIDDDGFAHLQRFRRQPAFPPVIMLTAAGNESLAVQAIKGGAADYIPKQQMTHERLIASIQSALDSDAAGSHDPTVVAPSQRPPPELSIPGYRLIRRLAEGGAGTVYQARQFDPPRDVAIKVMAQRLATGEESREALRLSREYELLGKVDSSRIVRLYEFGVAGGHVFVSMEMFREGSLAALMLGALPRDVSLDYLAEIASALDIVHRAGILHRDLKPANVMLREDGSLALIDFGTARHAGMDERLTLAGRVMGTPHYMSPEQCSGLELDPTSDLYAAGILFYEMLTGYLPYVAATPMAVLYKHQYAPLPQLPRANADLQPLLDSLLAKDPAHRCRSAKELLLKLKSVSRQSPAVA